eukprot:g5076.t1
MEDYEGSEYHTEQLRCCQRLGHWIDNDGSALLVGSKKKFIPGTENPVGALRDIQRYLRRDDPIKRNFYRTLGRWKVVQTKLIPLVLACRKDPELVFQATKLLVMVTMPLSPDQDRDVENAHIEADLLVEYVEACLKPDIIAVFSTMLEGPLSRLDSTDTSKKIATKDQMIIELVLTFFRNLLLVKNVNQHSATALSHRSRIRDELMLAFGREDVFSIILLFVKNIDLP